MIDSSLSSCTQPDACEQTFNLCRLTTEPTRRTDKLQCYSDILMGNCKTVSRPAPQALPPPCPLSCCHDAGASTEDRRTAPD
eukprot:765457-Hanusia_phi.AAC.1